MNKAKMTHPSATDLHTHLFTWWRTHGRLLPWREKESAHDEKTQDQSMVRDRAFHHYFASTLRRDPYRVVVAEMMLQQTQVDRVFARYMEWMKKWPTMTDFAQAPLSEVLIFWQGLGYNRRARFLWLLAQEIINKRQGVWPTTEAELRQLPGIGQYTARAILSFAFGQHVGVVDTNVKRIYHRVIWGGETNLDQSHTEKEYTAIADQFLPPAQADPWNQALMDFGALLCVSRTPKCSVCPIAHLCVANRRAQEKGYKTYADFLLEGSSLRKRDAKPGIKFVETDRYFRGRILDELREGNITLPQLQKRMSQEYGLNSTERFEKLLNKLQEEGLISVKGDMIHIG